MKTKTFKLISLIVALLAAVALTVGYVFAWFLDKRDANFTVNGHSAGAYFDSGDGSKEKPFVIANPTHMHNLAVLQNTGRFVTGGAQKQYYFEIKKTIDEIDMSGIYIPPIGNDEFPFIGIFNGNGKTLANLKVTTNKSLLGKNYPTESSTDYAFSRAVGLFGMTGDDSDISNVILSNPLVDVANTNTKYLSADAEGVKAAQRVAGIAIGFVAGKCSSIGVRALNAGAALDMNVSGYSTFNSILGALGDNVSSAVTGGGHVTGTGGSGNAFGASFDVDQLAERLTAINDNKNSATPSPLFPETDTQSNIPVPQLGYQVPFTVDTAQSSYTGSEAREETANDNIGYIMGNQNKISAKKMNFIDNNNGQPDEKIMEKGDDGTYYLLDKKGNKISPNNNNIPRWFYVQDGGWINSQYQERFGFAPISNEKYESLPQNVKDILTTQNQSLMRIQAGYMQYDTAPINSTGYDAMTWGYHGQIKWMGKTYGDGLNRDGYIANQEGEWLDSASGNYMDGNGYVFYLDEDNNKRYIPSINSNQIVVEDDGRIKYSWADWYFKDADGNDFNVYEGKYMLDANGKMYDAKTGSYQFMFDAWNNAVDAIPMSGKKIPSYSYKQGVALPNNGIWFKPSSEGMIRFVMFAQKDSEAFCLLKFTRTNADRNNPFYTEGGSDITVEKVIQQQLPPYVLFYYEYPVTAEDIAAGNVEFAIMVDNNVATDDEGGTTSTTSYKGAYFVYLDLGASAADDVSGIDREKSVSAIDFIYDGVEIKQGNPADDAADALIKVGDFIVKTSGEEALYESSKTSVYFENISTVFKLVFLRLHNEEGKHAGKTICLEKSNPVPDKDSEVKATFATYVCPTIGGGSGTVGGGGGTVTPTPTPTELTLTVDSSLSLTKGGTKNINASVNIDGATITYSSNNTNVASVGNDGTVTAVAAGTAKITVTATDGTTTVTKEVTVTVTEASSENTANVTLSAGDYTTHSGKPLAVTDTNGYLSVTSSSGKNYKYADNANVGSSVLVGSGNGRDMIISAGADVESVTVTLKIAVAGNEALTSAGTATVTIPSGVTIKYSNGSIVNGTISTSANDTVVELEIVLGAGQSVTFESTQRLAFISATAQVVLP